MLSTELRDWIVPGLAGVVAIVDADGLPHIARVWGARVSGDAIDVYVQRAAAGPVLEALIVCRRAALNLIEVATYRSRLFKGSCEVGDRVDFTVLEDCLAAIGRAFHGVGLAADGVDRMLAHGEPAREMVALRVVVEHVFDQSPRPGAGARL